MEEDRYICPWCKAEVGDDAWRCLYCGGLRPRSIGVAIFLVLAAAGLVVWFIT